MSSSKHSTFIAIFIDIESFTIPHSALRDPHYSFSTHSLSCRQMSMISISIGSWRCTGWVTAGSKTTHTELLTMCKAAKFEVPNFKNRLKICPNCYNNPSYIVYFALMIVPTFFTKYQTIIMTHQIKLRQTYSYPSSVGLLHKKYNYKIFINGEYGESVPDITLLYNIKIIMQESSVQKHIHMVDAKC